MTTVVIVIHLMVVLAMIGLVLLQRSEGGALGIGGGQGAFMSDRSAGNVLTRSTAILAIAFFATSLGLALLAKYQARPADILERIPGQSAPAATETPAPPDAHRRRAGDGRGPAKQLGGVDAPVRRPADASGRRARPADGVRRYAEPERSGRGRRPRSRSTRSRGLRRPATPAPAGERTRDRRIARATDAPAAGEQRAIGRAEPAGFRCRPQFSTRRIARRGAKARIPWRGTSSLPAAWSPPSARVSHRRPWARCCRRAATRSGSVSSTRI